jgi:CelD/BcsL family acetyltransferase involved in cellulose biosynthesis
MTVVCIKGSDLGSSQIENWRRLQLSHPSLASPYFCPEFTQAVAAVRDDVEVGFIKDAQGVQAVFPFQRGPHDIGSPVGGCMSDYQGLICAPGFSCDPRWLLESCNLIAWDFDHVLADQICFKPHHTVALQSPVIDLSGGFEAYAKNCHGVKAEMRKLKRLERECGPLRLITHSQDKDAMAQVLAWKSAQYIATSMPDLFVPSWTRNLVEHIHGMRSADFAGTLSLLFAGDRLVAGHFGMTSKTVWHWWFPSYDKELGHCSPGLILLIKMAEAAEGLGLKVIDLGAGDSLYKGRFTNNAVPLAAGFVERPSFVVLKRRIKRGLRAAIRNMPFKPQAKRILRWASARTSQLHLLAA